jgi:hypothetical protein
MTIEHIEAFKLIRSALAQPNRALKVIQLIHALARSSGRHGATLLPKEEPPSPKKGATRGESREDQGRDQLPDLLGWEELGGFGITEGPPIDTGEGTITMETLISACLLAQQQKLDFQTLVDSYVESYGEPVVVSLVGRAAAWAARGEKAKNEFGRNNAPAELKSLVHTLKPLVAPMREKWLAERGKTKPRASKQRVARGVDTPEFALARAHWSRFKKAINKRPSLADFYEHMVQWVDRSPTVKGHFHYRPPNGDQRCPFWLTE